MQRLRMRLRRWLRALWQWMTGWIPVNVWLVTGPPGGGPWFETPEEAAEFCTEECAYDNGWDGDMEHTCTTVYFMPNEIAGVRGGKTIERAGWRIERMTISRRELSKEWSGW